jgi:hypothetical protein
MWMHSPGAKTYARFPHQLPVESLREDGRVHVRIGQRAEGGIWFKATYQDGVVILDNGKTLNCFDVTIQETYVLTDDHGPNEKRDWT